MLCTMLQARLHRVRVACCACSEAEVEHYQPIAVLFDDYNRLYAAQALRSAG